MQQITESLQTKLSRLDREKAISGLKDYFKSEIKTRLNLHEVSAPLTVIKGTGINDDLNGIEKPVQFLAKSLPGTKVEIVQSLAKWKRLKLAELGVPAGQGIITDMRALRPDEIISPIHSIFVDQWDWERSISIKNRNLDFLESIVKDIYKSIKETERYIVGLFPSLKAFLPKDIKFIHSEELQYRYPKLSPKQREKVVARDHGAVFIIGIGHELVDGVPHDLRAPDYDDWSTPAVGNYKGLNGDIIVWNPILKDAFEISSMGIRVDKKSLQHQLSLTKTENRLSLSFHSKLMNDELPLSIGGGIGQSRLAMLLLRKKHIGEVQASIWPEVLKEDLKKSGINLL